MLFPTIIVTLAVTLIFMIALRPLAESIGLVDRPGGRKSHVGDVPIVGGPAMFLAFMVGMALLPSTITQFYHLLIAAILLVIVGLIDDRYSLPATVRLVAQVTAILIMVYGADITVHEIGNPFAIGAISMGPFSLIFTIAVALTVVNSFNLIDGVDGLAGSMAFITLLCIAIVAGLSSPVTNVVLIALAAIFGFLLFNFPMIANRPVRSFMGDSGSTFLGLVVVWLTISISQEPAKLASPVVCLWFAALPLFDILTCTVRRIARRVSPFRPGRDHFHHTLKRGGLGVRQTLGVMTGFQLLYASFGLIAHFSGATDFAAFAVWVLTGTLQHWMIRKIAVSHRLTLRRLRIAESLDI